jgi:cytochrome c553
VSTWYDPDVTMPQRTILAMLTVATLAGVHPASAQTVEEKAQLCHACHGETGVPQEKGTPIIWGQHQGYTISSCATTSGATASTSR